MGTFFLKAGAIWLLIQSIFTLILGTLLTSISTVIQVFGQVLTGRVGIALLGLSTLWFGSYVLQANQTVLTNGIDSAYCQTAKTRQDAVSFAEVIFPQISPFICLWDWGLSFTSFATSSLVSTAFPCVNYQVTFVAAKEFVGTILQTVLTFFFIPPGPTENKFDFASIFAAWAKLIDTIRPVFECVCDGIIELYDFIISIITDDNLGCFIDQALATVVQFLQGWWHVFFNNLVLQVRFKPSLLFLDSFCSAIECLGDFIDNTILGVFQLFILHAPNLRIGCIVARLVCLLTDIVFIFFNIAIEIAWDGNFDAILQTNFVPLLSHLSELGECLYAFFSVFDLCLGQTVGSVVWLIRDFIAFGTQLVQQGQFEFSLLSRAVLRLVGQATYGNGAHVGRNTGHNREFPQTSLTCLVTKIFLVTGNCAFTYGDVVNSLLEFLLIPMELVQAIIDNADLLASLQDSNPVDSTNRPAFTEFLNAILNVIVDRLFGIFDYLAHTLECPTLLQRFGQALVSVVKVLRQTWTDVQNLVIVLIELIFQSIVLLFTLFGADIYGDFSTNTATWVEIFVQVLLVILEVLFQVFVTLVDYILFPYFPLIFGQDSLLTYTGTAPVATFTACIASFAPDCICGLTLALANELCLPAGLGCLGDLWPGCGKFQTTPTSSRRREFKWDSTTNTNKPIYHADELPYEDVFDYFATEFSDGFCGKVFSNWKDTMKSNATIGELDAAMYVACLGMIRVSANFGNATDAKMATKEGWFMDTSKQTMKSFGTLFVNQAKSALSYGTSVSCLIGSDGCGEDGESFSFEEDMQANGIDNPIARDIAMKTYDLVGELKTETVGVYNSVVNDPTPNVVSLTLDIVGKGLSITGKAWGIGRFTAKELGRAGVWEDMTSVGTDLYSWATTTDWSTYKEPIDLGPDAATRQQQRRHHNDGDGPRKEWLPKFQNETYDELKIYGNMTEKALLFWNGVNQFSRAARGWAGLAFGTYMYAMVEQQRTLASVSGVPLSMYKAFDIPEGNPYDTVAPFAQNFGHYYQGQRIERRSIWKDIHGANNANTSYPYSPLEVGKVHTNLTFIYGTGGYIRFANHIPDSCTNVGILCSTPDPNTCLAHFGLCQDFLGGYSIVSECSSVNGNQFQAFAVYTSSSCSNAPVIVVYANATSPTACKSLVVGGNRYYFCVLYNGCQACPVDQVIPGFECPVLDQTFHRAEEFGKICLAEFLGVKTVDFTLNFSTPISDLPDVFKVTAPVDGFSRTSPTPTPVCDNVCGNGILEPCEQCDDGNRFSNDGCSYPSCKIEKCPAINFIPVGSPASQYCHTGIQVLSNPSTCITTAGSSALSQSLQISCIPAKPMIYSYPTASCVAGSEIDRTQITKPCGQQPTLCLQYILDGNGDLTCTQITGTGTDFTCSRNCYVCGNGIKEPGEECDNNPYTSLTCDHCLTTCKVNETTFGSGTCRFGTLDGIPCTGGVGHLPVCNGGANGVCLYDNCFTPSVKRYDPQMEAFFILANYSHKLAAEQGELQSKRDVAPACDTEFIYNEQAIMNYAVVQKSNALTTWIEPVFNKIVNYITNGDGNISQAIADRIISSVGSVDYSLNVPPDERSFMWYVVFPFWCRVPGNLIGQVGYGLWTGTLEFLKWTAISFVIAGIIYSELPSFLLWFLMLFGSSIYLGLTFGFASPGCTLFASPPLSRLPIHLFDEVLDVMLRFNSTYVNWPEGFITGPTNGTCVGRESLDCQQIGFYDGIDEWYFLFQWWKPSINDWIFDSPIGGYLSGFVEFSAPRANFAFTHPSPLQQFCFGWNVLMLSQPLAIATFAALLAVGGVIILYFFFYYLGLVLFAILELIGAFQLDQVTPEQIARINIQFEDLYAKKTFYKGFANVSAKYQNLGSTRPKQE